MNPGISNAKWMLGRGLGTFKELLGGILGASIIYTDAFNNVIVTNDTHAAILTDCHRLGPLTVTAILQQGSAGNLTAHVHRNTLLQNHRIGKLPLGDGAWTLCLNGCVDLVSAEVSTGCLRWRGLNH